MQGQRLPKPRAQADEPGGGQPIRDYDRVDDLEARLAELETEVKRLGGRVRHHDLMTMRFG